MPGLILVAGEALIDLVPSSEAADSVAAHPGGGPFNAARAIGRLERPVAYLGRLSRDRFRPAAGGAARRGRRPARFDRAHRRAGASPPRLSELDAGGLG